MNAAFDACFKTSAKLVNATLVLGIAATCEKNKFGTEAPPRLANT
jgi:hypothetical protein